jgi:hypothetical protein
MIISEDNSPQQSQIDKDLEKHVAVLYKSKEAMHKKYSY